ncbi:hypothetical protein NL676_038413 [Syzygium grande]|nr:hypothetical protein NL676_038413 [Syzygium grande]
MLISAQSCLLWNMRQACFTFSFLRSSWMNALISFESSSHQVISYIQNTREKFPVASVQSILGKLNVVENTLTSMVQRYVMSPDEINVLSDPTDLEEASSSSQFTVRLSQKITVSMQDLANINAVWASLIIEECFRLGLMRVILWLRALQLLRRAQDFMPLLLLTADHPPEVQDDGANQPINQVNHFGSFVRYFLSLPVPSDCIPARMELTTLDSAVHWSKHHAVVGMLKGLVSSVVKELVVAIGKILDLGCQLVSLFSELRQVSNIIFSLSKAARLLANWEVAVHKAISSIAEGQASGCSQQLADAISESLIWMKLCYSKNVGEGSGCVNLRRCAIISFNLHCELLGKGFSEIYSCLLDSITVTASTSAAVGSCINNLMAVICLSLITLVEPQLGSLSEFLLSLSKTSVLTVIQSVSDIYLQNGVADCCCLVYILHAMALQRLADLNRQIKSASYVLQSKKEMLLNISLDVADHSTLC